MVITQMKSNVLSSAVTNLVKTLKNMERRSWGKQSNYQNEKKAEKKVFQSHWKD